MSHTIPALHMFCGKIASGKSSLASQIVKKEPAILLSEDQWLHDLFDEQIASGKDFLTYSSKLRAALAPHIEQILNANLSVVLDFHANTLDSRTWLRSLIDKTQANHILHVLETPDSVCLDRLRKRNASGEHPFSVTEAEFHSFSRHFTLPSLAEGFETQHHA